MTKLLSLLEETGTTFGAFGARLDPPRGAMTVWRWAHGHRVPRPKDAAAIIAGIDADTRTAGRLTRDDIYRIPDSAEAA